MVVLLLLLLLVTLVLWLVVLLLSLLLLALSALVLLVLFFVGVVVVVVVVFVVVELARSPAAREANTLLCVAQKPASRGCYREARLAGGWDFQFWLWCGCWSIGGCVVGGLAQRPTTRGAGSLRFPEIRHARLLPRNPPCGRLGL